MAMDYRADSPRILLEFLSYHETVKAHSQKPLMNTIWTFATFCGTSSSSASRSFQVMNWIRSTFVTLELSLSDPSR